jgi:steroid delta-isomerase-like uncharacterized protein
VVKNTRKKGCGRPPAPLFSGFSQLFQDLLNLVTFLLRGCIKVELSNLFYPIIEERRVLLSTATHKAIVRRYIEQVLNEQRHDLVEEFLAGNIELHGSGIPPGLEVVKQWFVTFAAAFPDGYTTIEDIVAEQDKVVARTTFNGTHQAEMQGIPATGKTVNIPGIAIFKLDNGKIAEGWLVNDNLRMMQQLGLMPVSQEN